MQPTSETSSFFLRAAREARRQRHNRGEGRAGTIISSCHRDAPWEERGSYILRAQCHKYRSSQKQTCAQTGPKFFFFDSRDAFSLQLAAESQSTSKNSCHPGRHRHKLRVSVQVHNLRSCKPLHNPVTCVTLNRDHLFISAYWIPAWKLCDPELYW